GQRITNTLCVLSGSRHTPRCRLFAARVIRSGCTIPPPRRKGPPCCHRSLWRAAWLHCGDRHRNFTGAPRALSAFEDQSYYIQSFPSPTTLLVTHSLESHRACKQRGEFVI
ncbi:unnamed protein product, partial [Ectocarpus sp. 12 AP-2014]